MVLMLVLVDDESTVKAAECRLAVRVPVAMLRSERTLTKAAVSRPNHHRRVGADGSEGPHGPASLHHAQSVLPRGISFGVQSGLQRDFKQAVRSAVRVSDIADNVADR